MPNCAVFGCLNHNKKTKGTDIKYFRFPKQVDLANQWINACCRADKINLQNASICSQHFEESCFEVPLKQRLLNYNPKNARYLKTDSVPTINVGQMKRDIIPIQLKRKRNSQRAHRLTRRRDRQEVSELLLKSLTNEESSVDGVEENLNLSSTGRNTVDELNGANNCDGCEKLREQVASLQSEKTALLKKIEMLESKPSPEALLARIFTSGQIKKLSNPDRNIHWSPEDIAAAISLRSVSPKAYRYYQFLYTYGAINY
jgi:hypothetical protein